MSVSVVTPIFNGSGVNAGAFVSTGSGLEVRDYTFSFTTPADLVQWDHIAVVLACGFSRNTSSPSGQQQYKFTVGGTVVFNGIGTGLGLTSMDQARVRDVARAVDDGLNSTIFEYWHKSEIPLAAGTTVTVIARIVYFLGGAFGIPALSGPLRDVMYAMDAYQIRYAGRLVGSNNHFGSQNDMALPATVDSGVGDGSAAAFPTFIAALAWDSGGAESLAVSGGFTDLDNFTRTATGRTLQGDDGSAINANNRARDVALYTGYLQLTVVGTALLVGVINGPNTGSLVSCCGSILAWGTPPAGLQPNLIRNALDGYVLHYLDLDSQLISRHYDPNDAFLSEVVADAGPHCSCPAFYLRDETVIGTYLVDQDGKLAFSFDNGYTYTTVAVPGSWDRLYSQEQGGRIICMGWRDGGAGLGDWSVLAGDLSRDPTTGALQVAWGTEGLIIANATKKGRMPEVVAGQAMLLYQDQFGVWQLRYTRNVALDGSADWIDMTSLPGTWDEVTVQVHRDRMIANVCVEGDHLTVPTTWQSIVGKIVDDSAISWGSASVTPLATGLDYYPYGHLRSPFDKDLNLVISHTDATWRIRTSRNLDLNGAASPNWF